IFQPHPSPPLEILAAERSQEVTPPLVGMMIVESPMNSILNLGFINTSFTDSGLVAFADGKKRALNGGSATTKHISVCVCSYKRPTLLKRLLACLDLQDTGGRFTYSIVVVDNDHLKSSETLVSKFSATSTVPIKYCVEPHQNIPLARNKAVENAHGDFIAFIDDDEFPVKDWLLTLFDTCNQYGVDAVLGPVRRHFDDHPPSWLPNSNLY